MTDGASGITQLTERPGSSTAGLAGSQRTPPHARTIARRRAAAHHAEELDRPSPATAEREPCTNAAAPITDAPAGPQGTADGGGHLGFP